MMAFTNIAICTAEFFHPALGIEIALRSDDAWWVWSGDSPYDIHRNTQNTLISFGRGELDQDVECEVF